MNDKNEMNGFIKVPKEWWYWTSTNALWQCHLQKYTRVPAWVLQKRVWHAEHHDGGILQDDSLVYNHSKDNISE